MANTIYLEKKDIPQMLLKVFPNYTGKKFQVEQKTKVSLSGAYWDGGSRNEYRAVNMDTGEILPADGKLQNPFTPGYAVPTVEIPPRVCVVEHTIFCGKDLGITFHVNPSDYQNLLPPGEELTEDEKKVLVATRCYKSSYNGQTRQQMSKIPLDIWKQASETLKDKGLLDKRGAITNKGRNAVSAVPSSFIGC